MSIRRMDFMEKSSINASWLEVLAQKLTAGDTDYLKQYFEKNKKFSSVEDKLNDIKARIGFEQHKTGFDQDLTVDVKTASYKHKDYDVKRMSNILSFIKDMIIAEPNSSWASVLDKCRREDQLYFDLVPINLEKLKSYAEGLMKNRKTVEPDVKYVNMSDNNDYDRADDIADYYRHSMVN